MGMYCTLNGLFMLSGTKMSADLNSPCHDAWLIASSVLSTKGLAATIG